MDGTDGMNPGSCLQGGKYRIEKVLGQGGFGITYLAEQTNLRRKVCIKELFVKGYGSRNDDGESTVLTDITPSAGAMMDFYREKFVREARTIALLDHPEIVRIHDVFEENGTAYFVMDYIEGENIKDIVEREGALPEERALKYIRQVADALAYVHSKKIMHLDVKPSNILVRKSDDRAILIDFGTAKQFDSSDSQTSTSPIGLSAGYAPIELMKVGGVQTFSPEADVYSLGATLYFMVTGKNPPEASERMEMLLDGETFKFPDSTSRAVANVIEQSMQARKKRIQNIREFLDTLDAEGGFSGFDQEIGLDKGVEEAPKDDAMNELKTVGSDEESSEVVTGDTLKEEGTPVHQVEDSPRTERPSKKIYPFVSAIVMIILSVIGFCTRNDFFYSRLLGSKAELLIDLSIDAVLMGFFCWLSFAANTKSGSKFNAFLAIGGIAINAIARECFWRFLIRGVNSGYFFILSAIGDLLLVISLFRIASQCPKNSFQRDASKILAIVFVLAGVSSILLFSEALPFEIEVMSFPTMSLHDRIIFPLIYAVFLFIMSRGIPSAGERTK